MAYTINRGIFHKQKFTKLIGLGYKSRFSFINSQQEINVTETRIFVSPCDRAYLHEKLDDKQKAFG